MVQPRGFTPRTRPIDTFVSQSTVAPINITSPLNQVAQSLAIIEPALQKYIGQEIDKVKAAEIKEAESAGESRYRWIYSYRKIIISRRNKFRNDTRTDS